MGRLEGCVFDLVCACGVGVLVKVWKYFQHACLAVTEAAGRPSGELHQNFTLHVNIMFYL